jgi:hypothetical protein
MSVAISSNLAVVGASGEDTTAMGAGSAYVFDASTGALLHTLNNPTPAEYDGFGASVALSGKFAVVRAPGDDTVAVNAGSVYVFNAGTGALLDTLGDGGSVAVWGNSLLVGNPASEVANGYRLNSRRVFAVGAGSGNLPHVRVYDAVGGAELASFFAYDVGYLGGVRVAVADVNGDGVEDIITGTTPGTAGGHVKVIDGTRLNMVRPDGVIQQSAELFSFFATPGFSGGIFVAGGDVTNDGRADIIVGVDAGMPGGLIRVFDGSNASMIREFMAFSELFVGGARVASGDVNGDGISDIIVGSGFGAAPHIKVFSGSDNAEIRSFLAYDSAFMGGVFVATGYISDDRFGITNDLFADIVTSAGGDMVVPHVKVFDGIDGSERNSFLAAAPGEPLRGGAVAAVDRTGNGSDKVLISVSGLPSTQVRTFNPVWSANPIDQFFAFPGFLGEVFIG